MDTNITLSLKLYIANDFNLDHNITLSIDDVELEIYWRITTPITNILEEPWFATALAILVTVGLISLGIGFVYYYRVGRFPLAVRKVRKYRKSLNKEDPPGGVKIIKRDVAFKHEFSSQTKVISKTLKDRSGKKLKRSVLLGEFNKYLKVSKGEESTKEARKEVEAKETEEIIEPEESKE